MKALLISADNFEDSELLVPYYRLKEAGVEVEVASLSRGAITGLHGYVLAVDKTLDEVKTDLATHKAALVTGFILVVVYYALFYLVLKA